tara:strand:+ start:1304 stop:2449 length:1146 start_codon:yes stop_codon:yes gene_type:complete
MQNCIQDTIRRTTNLEDFYPNMINEPALLICNTEKERINKNLLDTSILLKNENINIDNTSYDDKIYSRNVPSGNFKVNIDIRPISSDPCTDLKFLRERDSLEKYNYYKPPTNNNSQKVFIPNKGTIKGYFDNIDMESELMNVNKIDTKCSLQLFKTHPNDSKSSLYQNKEYLIKNYKELEKENGYTWDNFNQYSLMGEFAPCKQVMKPCSITEIEPKRELITDPNIKHSGKIVSHPSIINSQQKQQLNKQINDAKKVIEMETNPNIHHSTPDIKTYKSKGVTNIYAPTLKKEGINKQRATARGMRDAAEISLKNPNIIRQPECFNPVEIYNIDEPVNLSKYNCVKEHQQLFTFSNQNKISKDCLYCEKLFNNYTKRRYIVP